MEALLAIFTPKNQSENLEQECGEKSIFIMKILFKAEQKPMSHWDIKYRSFELFKKSKELIRVSITSYNLSTVFSDQPYHANIKSSLF